MIQPGQGGDPMEEAVAWLQFWCKQHDDLARIVEDAHQPPLTHFLRFIECAQDKGLLCPPSEQGGA